MAREIPVQCLILATTQHSLSTHMSKVSYTASEARSRLQIGSIQEAGNGMADGRVLGLPDSGRQSQAEDLVISRACSWRRINFVVAGYKWVGLPTPGGS